MTTIEKQIPCAILTYGLYAQETGTKIHIDLESLHRDPNENNRVCPLEHLLHNIHDNMLNRPRLFLDTYRLQSSSEHSSDSLIQYIKQLSGCWGMVRSTHIRIMSCVNPPHAAEERVEAA